MDLALVREIEEVSFRAWPSLETRDVDGWILRAGGGVTGRANAVWPRADHGSLDLDSKLAAVAEFYASHALPAAVQLSPTSQPEGLSSALSERGYVKRMPPRSVQIAPLAALENLGDADRADVEESLAEDWYAVVASANTSFAQHRNVAKALLSAVRQPSAFALVTIDGQPAAAGRAVVDGRWVGVYNMATVPHHRRQGAAQAVLAARARGGGAEGADTAYLQVESDNEAAPALYAKAGFAPCYEYQFWTSG
jgi:N-acetylglutamate synthase